MQLEFSDNEGRQQIYTSCSYSLEAVCTTDQVLKQCHKQKVEKCNRLSSGPCPLFLYTYQGNAEHYGASVSEVTAWQYVLMKVLVSREFQK